MSETKFTPGPWRAHEPSVMEVIVYGGDNERVAKVTRFMSDIGIANAHLIAAAPELYAALVACVDTLHAIHLTYGFGSCKSQTSADQDALEVEIDKSWKPALAALAKAGEK